MKIFTHFHHSHHEMFIAPGFDTLLLRHACCQWRQQEPTSLFRAVNVSHRQMRCRHIVVATSHPSSDWNNSWYCSVPCEQDRDVATVTIIYSFLVGTLPLHARITSRVALTVRALNREDVRQFRNSKSVARQHRRKQLNQFRFPSGTTSLYFNAPYVCDTAGGKTQPDFFCSFTHWTKSSYVTCWQSPHICVVAIAPCVFVAPQNTTLFSNMVFA